MPSDWLITHGDPEILKKKCPDTLEDITEEDVVVWVDPLDGTSEYTQGKIFFFYFTQVDLIIYIFFFLINMEKIHFNNIKTVFVMFSANSVWKHIHIMGSNSKSTLYITYIKFV